MKKRYPMKGYPKPLEKGPSFRYLPVFKGYTVDTRVKQFRRFPPDDFPEFVEFDSEEGMELLAEIDRMAESDHDIEYLQYETWNGSKDWGILFDWGPPVGSLRTS
ncbi:MAG: hypothetical protein ACYDER_01335 [Ktedonobacteraceae bacterium]